MRISSAQDLGRYVKEQRRARDLTQQQLAHLASVSRRWLSGLEAGKETVEVGLVLRTLHALGLVMEARPEAAGPVDLDQYLNESLQKTADELLARYGLPADGTEPNIKADQSNVDESNMDTAILSSRVPLRRPGPLL